MRAHHHGFTLVELVLVLVLVSILAAIAIPRFSDVGAFEARGYYDEFVAALRYAQKAAVAGGCRVRVTVSASSYSVEAESCAPAIATACSYDAGSWPALPLPRRGGDFSGNAPPGVIVGNALGGAPANVVFCASGRASGSLDYRIDGGGFNGAVSIVAETGYVDANP